MKSHGKSNMTGAYTPASKGKAPNITGAKPKASAGRSPGTGAERTGDSKGAAPMSKAGDHAMMRRPYK